MEIPTAKPKQNDIYVDFLVLRRVDADVGVDVLFLDDDEDNDACCGGDEEQ